eukprot:403345697
MEEIKNNNTNNQQSAHSQFLRAVSGVSQTSIHDIYFETEEEVNDESSPLLQMNQQSKLVNNDDRNPLLANKGSATNGRILTEDDGLLFHMHFNSVIQYRHQNGSEASEINCRGSSKKKKNDRKYSRKQVSNLALQDDLMPDNQQNNKDHLSQSVQELDFDDLPALIKKQSNKDDISPPPKLIKTMKKSSTKDQTKQSTSKQDSNQYVIRMMNSGELTLNPRNRCQSFDEILEANSEDDNNMDQSSGDQQDVGQVNKQDSDMEDEVEISIQNEEIKEEDEKKYEKEMNQLFKIETKFLFRQSNNNLRLSSNNLNQFSHDRDLIRTETADFPMKLLTHAMLDPSRIQAGNTIQSSQDLEDQIQQFQRNNNGGGTPRFPTDEEIEEQELKMLLTFAFKDEEEIDRFSREMTFIINQDPIIERPPESKIKNLRTELRRDKPSNKKTLVFTSIDGLFMFSSHAQIVKTCDRMIKIRKDGIKRTVKLFYRPHLHTFIKTLSKYFELILYLREDQPQSKQWVEAFNYALEGNTQVQKKSLQNQNASKIQEKNSINQLSSKHFTTVLTKEQCIVDKPMRVICRNKDLLLEGRSIKNMLFITNDIRDMTLVHQNAIFVRSYHGNKYENTLAKLKIYLLKHILECGDVRDVIKRDFLSHTKQHQMMLTKKQNKLQQQPLDQIQQISKPQNFPIKLMQMSNQQEKPNLEELSYSNNQSITYNQNVGNISVKSHKMVSASQNGKSNSDSLKNLKDQIELDKINDNDKIHKKTPHKAQTQTTQAISGINNLNVIGNNNQKKGSRNNSSSGASKTKNKQASSQQQQEMINIQKRNK